MNSSLSANLEYLNLAVAHISSNKTVSATVKGVSKQVGYTAGGTIVGGVIFGPAGAFFGSLVGSAIGLAVSDDYDGVVQHVQKMNDQQKAELVQQIRDVVGANSIEQFYEWFKKPGSQDTVNTIILTAIGLAVATTQQIQKT